MEIEEILIKKEEIPILYDSCFQVPIHPKLLESDIEINPLNARKVFSEAAREWYRELSEYSKTVEDEEKKDWVESIFLKEEPKINERYGRLELSTVSSWECNVINLENGFASSLSINRNFGGSLYFNRTECESLIPWVYVLFSKEKAMEYSIQKLNVENPEDIKYVNAYTYRQHNVDHYPGALFLRNWAILYLNESLKEVFNSD